MRQLHAVAATTVVNDKCIYAARREYAARRDRLVDEMAGNRLWASLPHLRVLWQSGIVLNRFTDKLARAVCITTAFKKNVGCMTAGVR